VRFLELYGRVLEKLRNIVRSTCVAVRDIDCEERDSWFIGFSKASSAQTQSSRDLSQSPRAVHVMNRRRIRVSVTDRKNSNGVVVVYWTI